MKQNKSLAADQNVTMVIKRQVRAGQEGEYDKWLSGVTAAATKFVGYRSFKDLKTDISGERILVFSFDNQANLDNWLNSDEQKKWIKAIEEITESIEVQKLSGLEFLFNYSFKPGAKPPARYKMVILTAVAIYVWQQLIMNPFLIPLLKFLPPLVSSLILTFLTVTILTYILMPNVTKLFKFWLN